MILFCRFKIIILPFIIIKSAVPLYDIIARLILPMPNPSQPLMNVINKHYIHITLCWVIMRCRDMRFNAKALKTISLCIRYRYRIYMWTVYGLRLTVKQTKAITFIINHVFCINCWRQIIEFRSIWFTRHTTPRQPRHLYVYEIIGKYAIANIIFMVMRSELKNYHNLGWCNVNVRECIETHGRLDIRAETLWITFIFLLFLLLFFW